MSKISKFIICCIAVIISIVSLCVPTYCADVSSSLYTIDLVDNFPSYNNYYNLNNISYVTYKNFNVSRTLGNCLYGENPSDLPSSFVDGYIFHDNYTMNLGDYEIYIESSYILSVYSNSFMLSCTKFDIYNLENLTINFKTSEYSIGFPFRWVPSEFLSGLHGVINNLHLYGYFSFSYDIDYNGQYFYNDTFCFLSDMYITNGISNTLPQIHGNSLAKRYTLIDNYGDVYNSSIPVSSGSFGNNFLYFKNLLYSDRYINSLSCSMSNANIYFGNVTNVNRLYFQFYLKYIDYDQTLSINLFSGNSVGSGGAVGSLIPNGSNNFYKTAEWWDVPSHLYNFFIYLIFDAPIISNFTELVMVIISFIVEVFEFIIGLFNGINNIFFISIFVGIIVLIFLLKIIFKG